ncbi:hypothetical protein MIR68_002587 [Amoeboaphelidium protococcarum]|nr:hypothetical protein MIR68_002587 [Amoeboaphelidium protococcarum]
MVSLCLMLPIDATTYSLLELLPLRMSNPLYDVFNHGLLIDQLQNVQCYPLYDHIRLVQIWPETDAFQLDLSPLMAQLTFDSQISNVDPTFLQQCLKPLYDALDVIDFQDAAQIYKPLPIISINYVPNWILSSQSTDLNQKLFQKIYQVATPLSLERDLELFAQGKPLVASLYLVPVLPTKELLVGLTNLALSFTNQNFGYVIINLIMQKLDNHAKAEYVAHIIAKTLTLGQSELSSMIFQTYYFQQADTIQAYYEMCIRLIQKYGSKNQLQGVLKMLILVDKFNRLAGNSKEIQNLNIMADSALDQSLGHYRFVSSAFHKMCQKQVPSLVTDPDVVVAAFNSMTKTELQLYFSPPMNGQDIFLQLGPSQQMHLAQHGYFTIQELSPPRQLHLLNFETRFALLYRHLSLDQPNAHDLASTIYGSTSAPSAGQAVAFNQEKFLKSLASGVFDQSITSSFRQYYLQVKNGELDLALLNEDWSQCRQGKNVLSQDAKSYCILLGRLQNLIQPGQDKAQSASGNEFIVKPTQPIQSAVTDNISLVDGIPFIRRVVTTGDIASAPQDYSNLKSMLNSPLISGQHPNLMGDSPNTDDSGYSAFTSGAQFVPQYPVPVLPQLTQVPQTAAEPKKRGRPQKKRQKI